MHILAMSKDRSRKNGLESYWSIHEQGLVQQKDLSSVPMGVLLLQEIRDEAHRVAGQFHYQLVKKDTLRHGLEKFSGLGDAKKNLLLQTFGGWSGLKQVSVQQLLNIPGIGEKTAQRLISFLKNSP
jgi:excinuclease ABC subunit C